MAHSKGELSSYQLFKINFMSVIMSKKTAVSMQDLWDNAMLDAGSAAWLEGLYERYL